MWQLSGLGVTVLAGLGVILIVTPVTISRSTRLWEALVLTALLMILGVVHIWLVRSWLSPLTELTRFVARPDPTAGSMPVIGRGEVRQLIVAFNSMLDDLRRQQQRVRISSLEAQETERARIGQELHDEVGQGLTAVLLSLKLLQERVPEDVRDDFTAARDIARATLDETRRIVGRLRPGALDALGLVGSISGLASDLEKLSGVYVQRSFLAGLPELSRDGELVVYRVAQEALTNVARHAGATTCVVRLFPVKEHLVLEVSDDGVGGAADAIWGAGLQGMHERAALVGGVLDVGTPSGSARGTLVRLKVPVHVPDGERHDAH